MIGTKGELDAVQVQGEHVSGMGRKHEVAPNAEIESVLASMPNVAECAVLTKTSSQGDQQIAYLVTTGAFSSEAAQRLLGERAPGLKPPDVYVLSTRLPLNLDGTLAEAQLAQLPVVDESVAQALEAELLADPRIEHSAVFVDETPRRTPVLHQTDVLTEEALKNYRQAVIGAAPDRAERASPGGAAEQTSRAEAPSDRPPALSIGADLARGPDAPQSLPEALELAARRSSDARIIYLTADGATLEQSFHDLLSVARRIAAGLQSRGLGKGQHVMLQLAHPEEVLPAFWGCLLGGFIPAITPIPSSYASGTNELERLCHIWQMLEAPVLVMRESHKAAIAPFKERLAIADDRLLTLDALEATPDEMTATALDADDVAFLVFTSGSTGAPKIIMLTHGNILSRSQGTNELCRHDQTDRILNWLPFDHIGSISDWHLRCVDLGCFMVYCSKEHVLGDPLNWLRLIDRFRITHSWAPNFAYALVNEAVSRSTEQWDLSSMKSLLTAGETVSSNTVHEFLRRLEPHGLARTALRPAYGMAELGSGVTYFQPSPETPVRVLYADRGQLEGALRVVEPGDPEGSAFTSLGPIIPGAGMRIVDDQGTVLPELTIGRLQISGGPVCKGYYRNPEANREVFVGDGWFNTGDRGFLCARELYLTGRDKESLIINGANFHNSEIEAAVEEVQGVHVSFTAACAVRPRGEPEERLSVFFSTDASGPALVNLLRRVQNSVARKTGVKPDYVLPVGRHVIPKTAIGKIQRKQLTKRFESGDFADLVKRVDTLLENERTVPDWFLSPTFLPKAARARGRKQARRCLLVCDRDGLGEALESELQRRGMTVVRAARENAGGQKSEDSGFTDVIHLAGYAPDDPRAAGIPPRNGSSGARDGISTAAAQSATNLIRDIARYTRAPEDSAPVRHWIVSRNSCSVLPDDVVDPARAAIPALLKAMVQETPAIECRHLDLPAGSDSAQAHELCSWIGSELEAPAGEDEIAYRRGVRYAPAFTRIDWSASAGSTALRRGGLYLVTGGLGGVGTALSRYLLDQWAARVLVVGRTPLRSAAGDSGSDPSAGQKEDLLRELEQLGSVRYRALDVTREADLGRAVEEMEAEFGESLTGVFHLASAYHERQVSEETVASLASILRPKAEGAVAVHALLLQRPQAFVVCFSSLAAIFSGASIAGYAAANGFLDAFSREQRRQGKKSYSLNWSVWDGLGIGAASAPEEILRSKGYRKISTAQGMTSLAGVLGRAPDQFLAGVEVGHPSLLRLTAGPPQAVARLRGAFAVRGTGESDGSEPSFVRSRSTLDRFGQEVQSELWQLAFAPLTDEGKLDRDAILADLRGGAREIVAPDTPLEHKLVEIYKSVLGLETVGVNEGFFELGGTSLLSVRLFAEIERHTGARLPPATLFQAATVRAMAELLEQNSTSQPVESIVVLADAPGESALFLIHGPDGDTARYRSLAEHLNPKRRVYGVEPFRQGRFLALHTRFEQMVSHCAAKIREVEAKAPYLIGGWAEGGVLAFEVACRLQAQGHEVALVALFDSMLDDNRWRRLKRISLAPRGRRKALFDAVRIRMLRYYSDREQQPPWFLELIPPETVYRFASAGYRPSLFRGRLTLFRATGQASADPNDVPAFDVCGDGSLGWETRATQGVDTIAVAGGHVSMLDDQNAASLAERVSAAISRLP